MRQALVSSRLVGIDKRQTLADIMATAIAELIDQIKAVLLNLKVGLIVILVTRSRHDPDMISNCRCDFRISEYLCVFVSNNFAFLGAWFNKI